MRTRLAAVLLLSLASTGAFATQTSYEYTGFLHGQSGYGDGEQLLVPYDTQFVASFTYDDSAFPDLTSGNTKLWLDAVKGGQITFFNNEGDLGTMWNKDRTGELVVVNDYKDQFALTMMLASRPDDPANVRWFLRFATLTDSHLLGEISRCRIPCRSRPCSMRRCSRRRSATRHTTRTATRLPAATARSTVAWRRCPCRSRKRCR